MEPTALVLIAALAGLGAGVLLAYALLKGRIAGAEATGRQAISVELAQQQERARALEAERARLQAAREGAEAELARARGEAVKLGLELAKASERASHLPGIEERLAEALRALEAARTEKAGLQIRLAEEQKQAVEKLQLLEQARDGLTNQFKVLANEILEEKTARFTEQNKQNLDQVLEPLKTQLQEFKGRVDAVHESDTKDRSALKEQVQQLLGMNQRLSQDAHNLTAALKGSSKVQGDWGELVLDRILESAGLRKGVEYDVQESHTLEDGGRLRPDVVIHLPEQKHLVVDSKVSLTAYQAATSAVDEAERAAAIEAHLGSMRGHIKGLAAKSYQELHGFASLDFVVMFVPIEPAFMLAIQADSNLWQEAWEKNVLLVSPSTLLFVVRTVAHLWRQEQQTQNAQEIAKRGAELYDKFVGFIEDLDGVGTRLAQAHAAYEGARKKLSEGRGNVVRQAEMLRDLGVKPAKNLPQELVQAALEEPLELPLGRRREASKA